MDSLQTPPSGGPPKSNAAALLRRRRQQQANPLVKKRPQPKPAQPISNGRQSNVTPDPNGVDPSASSEYQGQFTDYPIVTTKRAILEGLRVHAMRFVPNNSAAVTSIDPRDEAQFTRPLRLHRRDPRFVSGGHWGENGAGVSGTDGSGNWLDDKARERLEIQRTERRTEREANQALIAPVAKTVPKRNNFQKKTEQVFQVAENSVKKKDQHIKYEESLPWHIEDFDNKNSWSGSYEAALSGCHALLIPNGGVFRMLPVEKWYKFTAKTAFKHLTIEEAEHRMGQKQKDPRWFMESQKASEQRKKEAVERQGKLFTRKGERGEKAVKVEGDEDKPEVAVDADDIDYNYDEAFADDEENPLIQGDEEEAKEVDAKIKREQREANIFELKEQKDFDKEEEDKKREKVKLKRYEKRIAKSLINQEKNHNYDTDDSDQNPYESDESSGSELGHQEEEERKKAEEEERAAQQDKAKSALNEKASSGNTTKGTNTPSNRPTHPNPLRKILKRPGSPNLSEASGNESARKKMKKKHPSSQPTEPNSTTNSRLSSPVHQSPSAPGNASRKSSIIKLNLNPTSLNNIASSPPQPSPKVSRSSAGSDSEMSDGGRRTKKLKTHATATSGKSSPTVSRPGSPVANGSAPLKKSKQTSSAWSSVILPHTPTP